MKTRQRIIQEQILAILGEDIAVPPHMQNPAGAKPVGLVDRLKGISQARKSATAQYGADAVQKAEQGNKGTGALPRSQAPNPYG